MSMHAMLMGVLVGDPIRRTGQSGKPFVTGSMRVSVDGAEPFLASLIAFSTTAADALSEHRKGDTLVCGGRANLKEWQGKDGEQKHGLGIVVEHDERVRVSKAAQGRGR